MATNKKLKEEIADTLKAFTWDDGTLNRNDFVDELTRRIESAIEAELQDILKQGHGGGNWRRLIMSRLSNKKKMIKPTAIEKDWEKELKQVLNCDAFSNSCVVDEKELRQFISNLLSKQRKELIEKDVIKNEK